MKSDTPHPSGNGWHDGDEGRANSRPAGEPGEMPVWQRLGWLLLVIAAYVLLLFGGRYLGWWGRGG